MQINTKERAWRTYERVVFELFCSTSHRCEKGVILQGIRCRHQIDVVVDLSFGTGEHRWLIECKSWSRRVGKRDVQAFKGVLDDLGADHGYMFSEKGFQKGAYEVARRTNITLTNLAALNATFVEEQLSSVHQQSRAFTLSVDSQDDIGNMDSEVVLKLGATDSIPVADLILEVHIIRDRFADWVMDAERCRKKILPTGELQISVPWDGPGLDMEHIPQSSGGSHPTGRTKTGERLDGIYRVVFRTLSGPVCVLVGVPSFK
jgi:hypothetical protein